MASVTLSPEGVVSFRRLPSGVKLAYDRLLLEYASAVRLRLPGRFPTHQLEGARNLWTLKVGAYRGIYHWDGHEARFLRFGHRSTVYERLPK